MKLVQADASFAWIGTCRFSSGPGLATTTLPYLIYLKAFAEYRIGVAAAGAVFAVILANIVAIFVLRLIGRNLQATKGGMG